MLPWPSWASRTANPKVDIGRLGRLQKGRIGNKSLYLRQLPCVQALLELGCLLCHVYAAWDLVWSCPNEMVEIASWEFLNSATSNSSSHAHPVCVLAKKHVHPKNLSRWRFGLDLSVNWFITRSLLQTICEKRFFSLPDTHIYKLVNTNYLLEFCH